MRLRIFLGAIALSFTSHIGAAEPDVSTLALPCVACHGMDGASTLPGSANLGGQNERYLLRQLELIKSGARAVPLMAGQLNNLNDEQLALLAGHFAALPPTTARAEEATLAEGESIYRAGIAAKGVAACTACHAPSGGGNSPAGYPHISGQPIDYVVAQLTAYREGERTTDDDYGGMMRDVAANLNDREIRAVANYVRGLH
jgi:cytochrome c553